MLGRMAMFHIRPQELLLCCGRQHVLQPRVRVLTQELCSCQQVPTVRIRPVELVSRWRNLVVRETANTRTVDLRHLKWLFSSARPFFRVGFCRFK